MTDNGLHANRVLISNGHTTTASFGELYAATPMHHVKGEGHEERVKLHYHNGVNIEYTAAAAIDTARKLLAALKQLPANPDISGALADLEETL